MTYQTPYGPIFYDSTGNDHRPNIVNSTPKFSKRHSDVKLQKAAWLAFREAERRYGKRTLNPRLPRKVRPARAIPLTGSWRSFALQNSLYSKDSSRYASPYTSGHVQAIAVDVSTDSVNFGLIMQILEDVGWVRARAGDEPWHATYGPPGGV